MIERMATEPVEAPTARGVDRTVRDRQSIPKLLRVALYMILLVSAVLSVPRLGDYAPLPVATLLDAWVLAFLAYCFFRGRTQAFVLVLLMAGYLMTRIVPALATESPVNDFLQAYRWVLYLAAFAFAIGRGWGSTTGIKRTLWALILLSGIKAALTFAVYGPTSRSGLLIENNFELALFAGLTAVAYRDMSTRARFWTITGLGAVVILSGSRSGAIAFALVVIYAMSQMRRAGLLVRYVFALLIGAMVYFVVQLFESRAAAAGGGVDRLNFFAVFVSETRGWGPFEWLFGTVPLTPLSPNACVSLAFYENLFATSGDGSCYSVILHAFMMRVIFDAGIVGLLLAFGVAYYALRRGGVTRWLTLTLVGIAVANSFSVSGLNSPYVALPILLAIMTSAAAGRAPLIRKHASSRMRESNGSAVRP